jgi:short-subunit dehydrogenase
MGNRRGTALITGASSGIGAAIARLLAGDGWNVVLVGRDIARLKTVASDCAVLNNGGAQAAPMDIRDEAAFGALIAEAPPIDLFVSNAGILDGRRDGDVLEAPQVAREVLEVNLLAAIARLHQVLPAMRARRQGRVALVASLAAYAPLADAPAYSASKAGLLAYGLATREALRGHGIGITVACPGYVATPMGSTHLGQRPGEISAEDAARRIIKATLRGCATVGFPAPLHEMARVSTFMPEWLSRLFAARLRFHVNREA